jgi:hypothetical protein
MRRRMHHFGMRGLPLISLSEGKRKGVCLFAPKSSCFRAERKRFRFVHIRGPEKTNEIVRLDNLTSLGRA